MTTRRQPSRTRSGSEKASFFKMRAQLLDKGRTNTRCKDRQHVGDAQGLRLGGENGLHTHPNETTPSSCCRQGPHYDADGGQPMSEDTRHMLPAARTTGSRRSARSRSC